MAYVYLIIEEPFEGETLKDWVKIGYSQNPPEWRMDANLKRGNPRSIKVAAAFEYPSNEDAKNAEKAAHKEFKEHLHQKEWFQLHWKQVEKWFISKGAKFRGKQGQRAVSSNVSNNWSLNLINFCVGVDIDLISRCRHLFLNMRIIPIFRNLSQLGAYETN